MKKFAFLFFFLFAGFAMFAQTADKQDSNNEPTYYVKIETTFGDMTLKLYNETPLHRDNFLKLVGEGFYDGTLFHRVINGFMIQGGDPDSKNAQPGQPLGSGTLGYRIPAEFRPNLFHKKGALAAARDNNPMKESSACQFYIVQGNVWPIERFEQLAYQMGKVIPVEHQKVYSTLGGTPFLDQDYTVFGEVVEGLEVIDKIAAVPTGAMDRPVEDVKMKITIIKK
mgnify:CR=1 FL=1